MSNKSRMAFVSLIGAIPGIALSVVLIMALINYFEDMSAMYKTFTGLTLAVSVGLSVLPVMIVVFGPKTEKVEAGEEEAVPEESSEELIADEAGEPELVAEEEGELDEFAEDEFEEDEFAADDDDGELDFLDEEDEDEL